MTHVRRLCVFCTLVGCGVRAVPPAVPMHPAGDHEPTFADASTASPLEAVNGGITKYCEDLSASSPPCSRMAATPIDISPSARHEVGSLEASSSRPHRAIPSSRGTASTMRRSLSRTTRRACGCTFATTASSGKAGGFACWREYLAWRRRRRSPITRTRRRAERSRSPRGASRPHRGWAG